MEETWLSGIKIEYNDRCVRIVDGWKIKNDWEMEMILNLFKIETGYKSKRTIGSWVREWKAHNWLYNKGLFKNHTKDTDLDENEHWWRLVIYFIIGR